MSDDMVVIRELADMAAREIRLQERVRELEAALRRIVRTREATGYCCSHSCQGGNCRYCQARAALTAPSATGEGP